MFLPFTSFDKRRSGRVTTIDDAEQAEPGDDDDRKDTVPSNKKRKEDADGDWPS